jgi:integrase
VDLDNRCISILRTVRWDLNSKAPNLEEVAKNEESIRVVGLPQELVLQLKKKKLESKPKSPVFCNRDGGFLRQTKIYDIFTKGFKDSGLEWSGSRITRHTWATLSLVANDGNITAIQATWAIAIGGQPNAMQSQSGTCLVLWWIKLRSIYNYRRKIR